MSPDNNKTNKEGILSHIAPGCVQSCLFTGDVHFWLDGQVFSHNPWSYIKGCLSNIKATEGQRNVVIT